MADSIPHVFYRFDLTHSRPEVVVEVTGDDGEKYQVCASFDEWRGTIATAFMTMKENTP